MNGMNYGCMIFDDVHEHGSGWAAQAGEAATRRPGTAGLSTDTMWITNLDYNASKLAGLSNHVRFQRSDYLREPLSQLASRHAIETAWDMAAFAAHLFDRTMRLVHHVLRMQHPPRFALRNGIRDLIAGKDPLYNEEAHAAITEAISYNTNCERLNRVGQGEEDIRFFKLPYREHALTVLGTPLPSGELTRYEGKLPKGNSEVMSWLEELDRPSLTKITADNFDPDFNRLLNWGNNPATASSLRRWVTTQELLCLCEFADVKIHDAFIAQGTFIYTYLVDILKSIPKVADMSLSAGLLFENLWTAAATPASNRPMEAPGRKCINAHTPFLRAMDRINCLTAAKRLEHSGFEIAGYATGAIRANCYGKSEQDIVAAAIAADLVPPFCSLTKEEYPVEVDLQAPTPLQVMQLIYGRGQREQLTATDQMIVKKILSNG